MSKLKIIIPIILIIIAMFCLLYFNKSNKDLIVGTSPTFPPFGYIGGDTASEIVGFDIELAKAIAKDYGKNIKIEIMNFPELIPTLQSGKIDMIVSIVSVTEERKKIIDFSDPYFSATQIAIIRADDESFENITTKEELGQNKKLASLADTTGVASAQSISGDNEVVGFNSWPLAFAGLLDKKVDAVIVDSSIAGSFLERYSGQLAILPIEVASEDYAVAVKKGNSKLLNSINKTIERLKSSGEYDRLLAEYVEDDNNE